MDGRLKQWDIHLWEVRNELEDLGIIADIYDPDILHETRGLANDALWFIVKDEQNKEVLTFGVEETSDFHKVLNDDDVKYESYPLIPGLGDCSNTDNILAIFDEGKGGIAAFETFESDTLPKSTDFCYQKGDIKTPDGDWEFVSKLYFKSEELEVDEYLDYTSKSSTIQIFQKDNTVIS